MDAMTSSSQEEKRSPTPLERLLINRNDAYNWIGLTFSQPGKAANLFRLTLYSAMSVIHSFMARWR